MRLSEQTEKKLLPGDSGSPVFRIGADGNLELMGLVSSGFLNKPFYEIPTFQHAPRNEDISKKSFIADLYPDLKWIKDQLEILDAGNLE